MPRASYPALDPTEAEKTLERAPLAKRDAGTTLELRAEDFVNESAPLALPLPPPPAPGAGATQEIRPVDILEEKVELNLPPPPPPPPPPTARRNSHSSVAPIALDLPLPPPPKPIRPFYFAESTLQLMAVPVRRNLGWVVAASVGISVIILMAAVVRRAYLAYEDRVALAQGSATAQAVRSAPSKPARAIPPAPPPPQAASQPATNAGSVPVVELDSLPRMGTIRARVRRKLVVDGAPTTGTSAVVECGNHLVQVGAGREHAVDVPCGGVVYVR
jgi:hypothetical protein